jgi:acetyltransferase-like isoleucine patch superfamily enzyme
MTIKRLDKKDWTAYFDRLSKALSAKNVTIEVAALGIGHQTEAKSLALGGLVYDRKSDLFEVQTENLDHLIHGPTTIGDNVTIGAGVVIENSIIGNNVNISQGSQIMLSVLGDGTFLPFRAAIFMTTLMENAMVAQNTCLQMCVIGRNTFIGAGSTFTDFSLIPTPLRALDGKGNLAPANREVLGGCVGHNCRIGSGMLVMPARTIESDVVLIASEERRVISRHISFADSDHHNLPSSSVHVPLYQPEDPDTGSW